MRPRQDGYLNTARGCEHVWLREDARLCAFAVWEASLTPDAPCIIPLFHQYREDLCILRGTDRVDITPSLENGDSMANAC